MHAVSTITRGVRRVILEEESTRRDERVQGCGDVVDFRSNLSVGYEAGFLSGDVIGCSVSR